MFLQAFLVFFLILFLRRKLRTFSPEPQWDKALTIALFSVPALFIIETSTQTLAIIPWIWHLLLLLLIGIIYKKKVFSSMRMVLVAITPFVFIFLIKDIVTALNQEWYTSTQTYFNYATSIAITWMIALLIYNGKQQKTLRKEHEKRQAEEAQNKLIAARKAELEALVLERTAELMQQKEELQHALTDLKATQAQLVHREKMASLGELTAGVAHEIQNPLNFVNNFSELNIELVHEINQELTNIQAPTPAKQNLHDLLNALQHNEQKIQHHGRRADGIVKSMLQHSRKTTGEKELTDINALADEYLLLSYHGLRAKDKAFNATIETQFDNSIGEIMVVPQEISRVLLNLFNNAFYAVHERLKKSGNGYKPTVTVSTRRVNDKIEICVQDNGMGISKSLMDKIFQPFFTTKPPGEGTGLGLSLSYDIIKAHGGETKVQSTEGEGSTFIILMPA